MASKKQNADMQKLVGKIIEKLEAGTPLWRKPWGAAANTVVIGGAQYPATMWPANVRAPAIPFGALHSMQLLARADDKEYKTNLWITKKAVAEVGAEVCADAKPVELLGGMNAAPVYYNIEQIESYQTALGVSFVAGDAVGAKKFYKEKKSDKKITELKECKGLEIVNDQKDACYIPAKDIIRMPRNSSFKSGDAYYATLWHEVVHWTGHQSRLNRLGWLKHHKFGSNEYAFEELVAELGAAHICARFGIEDGCQFDAYIGCWIKNFKQNGYAVLRQASEFSEAATKYIFAKPPKGAGQ